MPNVVERSPVCLQKSIWYFIKDRKGELKHVKTLAEIVKVKSLSSTLLKTQLLTVPSDLSADANHILKLLGLHQLVFPVVLCGLINKQFQLNGQQARNGLVAIYEEDWFADVTQGMEFHSSCFSFW